MNVKLSKLVNGMTVIIMLLVSASGIAPIFGSGNLVTKTPQVSGFDEVAVTGEPPDGFAHLGTSWSDFNLSFDPTQWDIIPFQPDWPGLDALAHRSLTGCRITPNIPVGLGDEWTSEDGSINLGGRQFQVKRFFQSGELKFVVYFGFINQPYEGAVEVHFTTDQKACLQAADAVFAATEVILPAQPTTPAPVNHNLPTKPAIPSPSGLPAGFWQRLQWLLSCTKARSTGEREVGS